MNLVEQVRQRALEQPNRIAFHYKGKDITYGEFEQAVGQFASVIRHLNIQKGDHIALLLGNRPEFLISLYAAMRAGVTVIPINPIYTMDEITYIVNNGDVKAIIAEETFLEKIEKGLNAFPQVETYIICESSNNIEEKVSILSESVKEKVKLFNKELNSINTLVDCDEIDHEDTAVILYTSGTTGYPKGAMLSHKNLYSNARDVSNHFLMSSEDRIIATLPLFHVFGLTVVANAPLLKGAKILIAPRFSPSEIYELADIQRATVFAGVPTMLNFLCQYSNGNPESFSNLRLAISGGAPLPISVLDSFEQRFNIKVSEGYGLSEAAPVTCFNPLNRERKPGSIGMSIPNVENRVVDDQGNEVPIGEVGELVVRGPNVMKGYYKLPEETSIAIRDGWLYTGDLAKKDEDDYFYIVDRKKDLIIVGGYNVYPREVEEVLYSHPNVLETAVVGIPDPDFGETVYAYVTLKENNSTICDLQQFCAKSLAKYKIPEVIEFIDHIPKNSTGKILKRELKQMEKTN